MTSVVDVFGMRGPWDTQGDILEGSSGCWAGAQEEARDGDIVVWGADSESHRGQAGHDSEKVVQVADAHPSGWHMPISGGQPQLSIHPLLSSEVTDPVSQDLLLLFDWLVDLLCFREFSWFFNVSRYISLKTSKSWPGFLKLSAMKDQVLLVSFVLFFNPLRSDTFVNYNKNVAARSNS